MVSHITDIFWTLKKKVVHFVALPLVSALNELAYTPSQILTKMSENLMKEG